MSQVAQQDGRRQTGENGGNLGNKSADGWTDPSF